MTGDRAQAPRASETLWAREQVFAELRGKGPGSLTSREGPLRTPALEAPARGETRPETIRQSSAEPTQDVMPGWSTERDRREARRIDDGLGRREERLGRDAEGLRRQIENATGDRATDLTVRLAEMEAQTSEVATARQELAALGTSEKTFTFERVQGDGVVHSRPNADGVFVIRHDGSLGNRVHEMTHAYQYATGTTSFPSETQTAFAPGVTPVSTEVAGYRRQFAADPNSMPPLSDIRPRSLSEITPEYVRSIYTLDPIGMKEYYYRRGGY